MAVIDGGANCCLLSTKCFHIESYAPNRFAVIKGCKESYVSKGNKIGSGIAVVISEDASIKPFGIRVREAVVHDNELTLLAEFQMRQFGVIVDTVPIDHSIDRDGTKGRQGRTVFCGGQPQSLKNASEKLRISNRILVRDVK